jgi:hypothetical protein
VSNNPYLEAQIIHCQEPKEQIIEFLEQKAKRFKNSKTTISNSNSNPKILIEFSSLQSVEQTYGNDNEIVQKIFQLVQKRKEKLNNIFDFQPLTLDQDFNLKKPKNLEENSLYLILKYKTNVKGIVRKKYNFTFKVIDYLGIKASYEEIGDGFLLFFATKDDFQLTQMDLNNLSDVKKWLQKKNIWRESFQKYLDKP